MPIPTTRVELTDSTRTAFDKLRAELDEARPDVGSLPCVDDWTVKDLLAVRSWWSEQVIAWIEAGRRGEVPATPAEGFRWRDTPRLNAEIVQAARGETYASVRARLEQGFLNVLTTIEQLDDRELLEAGVFAWAGRYPIARWISINTARQYTTARTMVRRALRERAAADRST